MTCSKNVGGSILIARDGQMIVAKGFGLADVAANTPIYGDTKFRIGSVTKQFTAAAILRLQEQGKLSVSDPLSKFIPDFPKGSEVTIHHLLTHTSGIHSYTSKPDFLQSVTVPVKPDAGRAVDSLGGHRPAPGEVGQSSSPNRTPVSNGISSFSSSARVVAFTGSMARRSHRVTGSGRHVAANRIATSAAHGVMQYRADGA